MHDRLGLNGAPFAAIVHGKDRMPGTAHGSFVDDVDVGLRMSRSWRSSDVTAWKPTSSTIVKSVHDVESVALGPPLR